jgi:cobalt-zinc-cadmium efflux system outer membrane protein
MLHPPPYVLAVAGTLLMAAPPRAAGQAVAATPPPLSLSRQQAIDGALAHNPQLRVAIEQVAEARARVVESTAFPDPTVAGDITGEQRLSRPGTNTGSDLGVGLSLPFPTKFVLRHRVGNADVRAAESGLLSLQQQIASQTAQAYDALLVALQHRADLQDADSLARDFLAKTETRFAAGSAPKLDVIKARVDAAQAVNDLLANQRDVANDRSALNRLLGRPLGFLIEPTDSLTLPDSLPALDTLEATAQAVRPELGGLASQRAGAGAAVALAREYWLPDVDLSVSRNLAQGEPNSYTTAIGFSVPLFFWNHQRGEVAEARHFQRELDATYIDLQAEVDQDVRTTYATAATARQQAAYLRDDLVPEARRAYDIARVSYGLGGSSALDVLDAHRTLLDAEAQLADALGAANDARADLERAVGASLDRFAGARHDH